MGQSQKQAQTDDSGWRSAKQVAALSTVIGAIYDQMLVAFSRARADLASQDQAEVADESGVVHQVSDAVNAVQDTIQDAGRVVIQRAAIIGQPSPVEVEQAVQNALQRLGIPSRARVEKISLELDALNELLDQQLAERRATQVAAQQAEE